ncbi:MAG: RNA methyltransferase, partial [Chloroflexota bacterium]
VYLVPGCVDPTNPKVVRSTMGALLHVPVITGPWGELSQTLEHCRLYVADFDLENGIPYADVEWRQPSGLIIGGEANGPSGWAKGVADQVTYIPMHTRVESLNAGVAGSVILFEADRQRRLSGDA